MSTSVAPLQRGSPRKSARSEPESIKDQARNSLDEARMVLPGIQAVFGFQLIAIFNERFAHLPNALKWTHFASLCLVVCTIALIMTPAAYDRIAQPDRISQAFLRMTSIVMSTAMGLFALAVAGELVVIGWLATDSWVIGILTAVVATSVFAAMWFVYPLRVRAAGKAERQRARVAASLGT